MEFFCCIIRTEHTKRQWIYFWMGFNGTLMCSGKDNRHVRMIQVFVKLFYVMANLIFPSDKKSPQSIVWSWTKEEKRPNFNWLVVWGMLFLYHHYFWQPWQVHTCMQMLLHTQDFLFWHQSRCKNTFHCYLLFQNQVALRADAEQTMDNVDHSCIQLTWQMIDGKSQTYACAYAAASSSHCILEVILLAV